MEVRYVSGVWINPVDGMAELSFKTRRIVASTTKRFNNSIHKTAKLSPAVRNLLDFIVQEMDDDNRVMNNTLLRCKFLHLINNDCGVSLKEDTVNKGFQELQRIGLLIPMLKRGLYTVNPIYYFNGSLSRRKSLIQRMLNASAHPYIGCNLKTIMGW